MNHFASVCPGLRPNLAVSIGRSLLAAAAPLACAAGISTATSRAEAQPVGNGAWKQYHDAKYNFALSIPAGWTVSTDDRRIVISSADRASFALIENFVPQDGETAEDHVDAVPNTETALLPGSKMNDAYTLDAPAKQQNSNGGAAAIGEQAVGIITYNGEHGPGQARVLCLVFPKGGLLFGLAAPNARFAADRPAMMKIIQSFQFTPAAAGPSSGGGRASAAPQSPAADSLTNIKYVKFEDDKEHAFSMEVPIGWSADGGTFRANVIDSRETILVRSPNNEMAVMIGDAGVPKFTLPTQKMNMLGHPEGSVYMLPNNNTTIVYHYLPALEFNRWYLTEFLSKSVDDLVIGTETDNPKVADMLTQNGQKSLPAGGQAIYSATMAATEFTCKSKLTGRTMAGFISTISSRYIGNATGDGNWNGQPNIVVWATGDNKTGAREQAVKGVIVHMTASYKMSAEWAAADKKKGQEYVAMMGQLAGQSIARSRAAMAQSQTMSRQTAQSSDDRRSKMMGDFKARMAAKDDSTRKMQNYSLDQTDVTNGSQSWKVASGYTNYYHNASTGTIVGTNDPGNPGVGFTQLGQR